MFSVLPPPTPTVGSALAASVCKKITGRLTSAIAKQEDVSVQLEALDIMADMLCRYTRTQPWWKKDGVAYRFKNGHTVTFFSSGTGTISVPRCVSGHPDVCLVC